MKRLLIILALVGAGCSGGGSGTNAANPTTSAAPTTTAPTPGLPAFLAEVRKAGLGTKDMDAADNQNAIIQFGNTICEGIVEVVQTSEAKPTPEQSSTFVRAAVENLCPEHRDLLP
jgi:hypothetical protein